MSEKPETISASPTPLRDLLAGIEDDTRAWSIDRPLHYNAVRALARLDDAVKMLEEELDALFHTCMPGDGCPMCESAQRVEVALAALVGDNQ